MLYPHESRIQYPCGIDADNLLCVAATSSDGVWTPFSNIPLNKVHLVFAAGDNIASLYPTAKCEFAEAMAFSLLTSKTEGVPGLCRFDSKTSSWTSNRDGLEMFRPIIQGLYANCALERNQYVRMSGTSMATPLVARFAATLVLENPALKGAALVNEIKSCAMASQRMFTEYRLKLPLPSWYKKVPAGDHDLGPMFSDPSASPEVIKQILARLFRCATGTLPVQVTDQRPNLAYTQSFSLEAAL